MACNLLHRSHSDSADVRTWSRRLIIMQIAKGAVLFILLFVLVRFAGVYHRATEFNHYVQEEVSLVTSQGSLRKISCLKRNKISFPSAKKTSTLQQMGRSFA